MNVTRNVIRDLWDLAQSGDAHGDSRKLIDEFLAADPAFAASLTSSAGAPALPRLEPPRDHDIETLRRAKRRLRRRSPLRLVALALAGLAIVRLVQQTTFTTSPKEVIALGIAAIVFGLGSNWHTVYLRERALGAARPPGSDPQPRS